MEQTITEADIHDFLDKLRLFAPNIGEYEYHSSNEHFQYLIKTNNHSIRVSMEQLIANRNKQLTQENFKAIAESLEDKSTPKVVKKPNSQEVFEKRVDAGYKIYRNLLYLLIIFGVIAAGIYFISENSVSHRNDYGETFESGLQTSAYNNQDESEYQKPKTEAELKAELYAKETARAKELLTGKLRYKPIYKGLLSMKVIGLKLTGHLTNNATVATFKNVKIKVTFLSNTGSKLFSRTFEVYDFVAPGSSVDFSQEIEVTNQEYENIGDYTWEVLGAEN